MSGCRRSTRLLFSLACIGAISWALSGMTRLNADPAAPPASGFSITTSAFQANGSIPPRFTCSGDNLSPALAWTDPPAGTQSFVLIVDDPDAPSGDFDHWVVYDLPASVRQLPEGVSRNADPEGGSQGRNDFQESGYGGPCPPPGRAHRYYFRLYALDRKLNLPGGASKANVEKTMKGHVTGQTDVMGRFKR